MKNATKLFMISLFFLVLVMLASCQKQKQSAEWKGMVEEENGVTVVKNPEDPLYGRLVFDLEEDLSIGREGDEDYELFRVADVQVDEDGNIYVLENGYERVQKYDRDGDYLCTIGRKGRGPGTYGMPSQVLIDDSNGTIGVKDYKKLIVFDKDGNHLDQDISLEERVDELSMDSNGAFWGLYIESEGDDYVTADYFLTLLKINSKGMLEKKLARYPYERNIERTESGSTEIQSGEEYNLFYSPVNGQHVVYGYSKEYELNVVDLEGNLVAKIKKDVPYQDFTDQEEELYRDTELPEHKPFFYSLFTDSEGRIYVLPNRFQPIYDAKTNSYKYVKGLDHDVFSKDGYFLYKTTLNQDLFPWVIKDGYYYSRETSEDREYDLVKRYKIKNWDEIKTGR